MRIREKGLMPYSLKSLRNTFAAGIASAIVAFASPAAAQDAPALFEPAADCAPVHEAAPMSALEKMRMAQAPTAQRAVAPAARTANVCRKAVASRFSVRPDRQDFLASRILPVSRTAFDSDWDRVRTSRSARARTAALSLRAETMRDSIARVNAWVNAHVAYAEDAAHYGQADYWAGAEQTLRAGRGDCEDYAIAKMQILAEMGISRDDMYLTIARDLVIRNDHAVLVVKIDGQVMVLDNASDVIADGRDANDLRPVFSFSGNSRYIHGYS